MGSFGERMRRERAKRGISLESVSETTKIRPHILEALEKEEFDKLPGGIFNKGFVRSYARFLGMDDEQVVKIFIEMAGDPDLPLPDPPVPPVRPRPEIPQPKGRRSGGRIAAIVVCAIAVLFGGWEAGRRIRRAAGATGSRVHRTTSEPAMTPAESVATISASSSSSQGNEQSSAVPATDQRANAAAATLQPASRTTTTPGPEPAPAAATPRPERFVILVKAKKPTWVSITADGKPVLEGVLKRKQKARAYSEVVLTTSHAGALAVARNGEPLPPLGDEDQQITVTFTSDGVTR
jgi:cytoskeleton protein RodZ